ncbi:MAG: YncE family protein [Candidatus Aegiribacteria sp.]|nr:YncE family protein [Candidatus Aegiribacteria sp.]
MKNVVNVTIVFALVLLLACVNSTGPDVASSTLSVDFTGSTDKTESGDASIPCATAVLSFSRLNSTGTKSSCVVTASWTICSNQDFNSYVLYRSETSHIPSHLSSADILGKFTQINTSSFIDNGVTWGTEYYYILRTSGSNGNGVWSNEVSINTERPTPSELSLIDYSRRYTSLAWTNCPDANFNSYKLYRSITSGIEDDFTIAELVYCTSLPGIDTYDDCNIGPSHIYYYALLTTNNENLTSWSNEISVRFPPSNVIVTVDVGINPWSICTLPSGEYVYVTNRGSDDVSVIRTSDNSVITTINVGESPYGICSLPSGDYVYVTNWGSDNVSVIRTSDNCVVENINVGNRPVGICSLPSGEYVYTANRDNNNVSVIRTSDNSVVTNIDVGTNPYRLCSLPSGQYVYVTNCNSNNVSVIRTSDNSVVETVSMLAHPIGISAHPSGEFVYVSNFGDDVVSIIRTSDNSVTETVNVGNGPIGLCFHPLCAYVANCMENTVSMIYFKDNFVITIRNIGENPSSICSLPAGNAVYIVNYYDGTVSVMH